MVINDIAKLRVGQVLACQIEDSWTVQVVTKVDGWMVFVHCVEIDGTWYLNQEEIDDGTIILHSCPVIEALYG